MAESEVSCRYSHAELPFIRDFRVGLDVTAGEVNVHEKGPDRQAVGPRKESP